MNDDYLWDRSGEPDLQIQQLEEILGTLRYQPKPLQIKRRLNVFPLLAIAATVAIALLAGGLWLGIQQSSIPPVALENTDLSSKPIFSPWQSVSPLPPIRRKPVVVVKHERREAVAAKQQLMFALRLASEKLNAAYRRTQSPTQIRNQHRAG